MPYRTAEYVERAPLKCWDCEGTVDVREFSRFIAGIGWCRRCFRRAFSLHRIEDSDVTVLGVPVDDETKRWAGVWFVRNSTAYR